MNVKRIKVGFAAIAMTVAVGVLGSSASYSGYMANKNQNVSIKASAYQVSNDLAGREAVIVPRNMRQALDMGITLNSSTHTFADSIENKNIFAGAIKIYVRDYSLRQDVPVNVSPDWVSIEGDSISLDNSAILGYIDSYNGNGMEEMYLSYRPDSDLSGLTIVDGTNASSINVTNPISADIKIESRANVRIVYNGANNGGGREQIIIEPYRIESLRREVGIGAELRVDDFIGNKSNGVAVAWKEKPDTNSVGDKVGRIGFSVKSGLTVVGAVNVDVSVKDNTPPVFNTSNPSKIIIRKNDVVDLSDVTASDPESGIREFTNDAQLQGINSVTNSKTGIFTVTYTATNNSGVSATLRREVEITNDQELVNKISEAEGIQDLNNATQQTRQAILDKITEAKNAVKNHQTPQADLDRLARELAALIQGVRFDKTALRNLVISVSNEKQAVKVDAVVVEKLRIANNVLSKETATWQEIESARIELEEALRNARNRVAQDEEAARQRQAEIDRQNDAHEAVRRARETLESGDVSEAKKKVALVQDVNVRAELNAKIQEIETLITKRNELQEVIRRGEGIGTQGMTDSSKNTLTAEINNAKQKIADKSTDLAEISARITAINGAITGLRVDKTDLRNTISDTEKQPQHIRDAVSDELEQARNTNDSNGATVNDVLTAKNKLESAVRNAIQDENTRQTEARNLLDIVKNTISSTDIDAAQNKIDRVQDSTIRQGLQSELNIVKEQLQDKKSELGKIIEDSKKISVDGMVTETVKKLNDEIGAGEQIYRKDDVSKGEIGLAIQKIREAVNELKTDKKLIRDAQQNQEKNAEALKTPDTGHNNNSRKHSFVMAMIAGVATFLLGNTIAFKKLKK